MNLLLKIAPDGDLPKSKEQLLRVMVEHHDQKDVTHVVSTVTRGLHLQFLSAIAFGALSDGLIALTENDARTLINGECKELIEAGQIASSLDPKDVLDCLVTHHVLVRSQDGLISFQHQQFQEWFASLKIEKLMILAREDDDAHWHLKSEIFNIRLWEEAIFFAVERLTADQDHIAVLAHTIQAAMTVDPMLAADLIYRSRDDVWQKISAKVVDFVKGWHQSGTVDRAFVFMAKAAKSDFSDAFWKCASNPDTQVYLAAIRVAKPFRIGVMGNDIASRLEQVSADVKSQILRELISYGDMNAMERAVDLVLAEEETNLRVQSADALTFRRADSLVSKVLNQSVEVQT